MVRSRPRSCSVPVRVHVCPSSGGSQDVPCLREVQGPPTKDRDPHPYSRVPGGLGLALPEENQRPNVTP